MLTIQGKSMRYVSLLLFLFLILASLGALYMQKDSNGNVTFSDTPLTADSVAVEVPKTSTAPAPITKSQTVTETKTETVVEQPVVEKKVYNSFDILSPADQASIQNQATIPVELKVDPPLQAGDKIQIYLDGNPWGPPGASTRFEFNQPDRGTHVLSAKLLDANGQVLRSSGSNTIYVHRVHLGTPPRT